MPFQVFQVAQNCIPMCNPCLDTLPCAARRMLEVTGGSMTTIYEAADVDFPAVYEVSLRLAYHGLPARVCKPPVLQFHATSSSTPLHMPCFHVCKR